MYPIIGAKQRERETRIAEASRAKFLRRAIWLGAGTTLLAASGWYVIVQQQNRSDLPGESFPSVGREHIGFGDALPQLYSSNPPSSGAHYQDPAAWGIYDYEVNERLLIHNLEHGGIWISYRPTVPDGVVLDLRAIVAEFDGSKLVMAPRSANDRDVAVVAWERVFKFDLSGDRLSDEQGDSIRKFYKSLKNRGPEFVPDSMPGVDPKSVQP